MKNSEIIQNFIEVVFNQGDVSQIEKWVHPQYQYTSPTERMDGPEALSAFVQAFLTSFPDLHLSILDQESGETRVFTRIRMTGTHRGEFLGMPPTNQPIDVQGCVISRLENGLIVEEWEMLDQLTLLQQLGVAA